MIEYNIWTSGSIRLYDLHRCIVDEWFTVCACSGPSVLIPQLARYYTNGFIYAGL